MTSTLRRLAFRWWWLAPALGVIAGGIVLWNGLVQEVIAVPAAAGHHDFLAFHSAARMITLGTPGDLYSAPALTALERQVIAAPVGAAGYMPYISPPFAAAVQAPLGLLSETVARDAWLLVNIPLALLCCALATSGMSRRDRVVAVICLVATFPFFQALVEGQWSFVMLLGSLVAVRALRGGRPGLAGVALATLALKPPLLVPVLVVLVCARSWRALAALLASAAALVVVTLPWTGLGTQVDYARYLLGVLGSHVGGAGAAGTSVWEGGLGLMEGVNGTVAGYVGQQHVVAVDALSAVVLLAVVARWAWGARVVGLRFRGAAGAHLAIAGVAAVLLTDVHLYPQDCVLALVALPWLTAMVTPARRLFVVLGLCAVLDTVWLDQLPVTTHLFAWVLASAVVWGTRATMAQRAMGRRQHARTAVAVSG